MTYPRLSATVWTNSRLRSDTTTAIEPAMIEISREAYAPIHRVLAPSPFSAEVRSVTAGNSPGWVFVDNTAQPSVVLVGSKGMEGFWLFNESCLIDAGSLRAFAEAEGREAMSSVGYDFLEISSPDPDAATALSAALSPWDIDISTCLILRNEPAQTIPDLRPTVISVSECLRRNLSRGVDLREKIALFWEDPVCFERAGGIGFCTVSDATLTSLCISAFVDGDVHCVDIETHEPYRRQGHGTAAASGFLRACVESGKTMHWSCMVSNIASEALARRVGLRQICEYQTFSIEF